MLWLDIDKYILYMLYIYMDTLYILILVNFFYTTFVVLVPV